MVRGVTRRCVGLRCRLLFVCYIYQFFQVLATILVILAICFSTSTPHCLSGLDAPDTSFVLPDFRKLSSSERKALNDGTYKLPEDYYLKMEQVNDNRYQLCVLKNPSDMITACIVIIGHVNESIPCNPDMRADCLPGAIIDSLFGLSVWNIHKVPVQYLIIFLNNPGVGVSSWNLTNTTNFSEIWHRALGCEGVIALDISSLVATILYIIVLCVTLTMCIRICVKLRRKNVSGNSDRQPLISSTVPPNVHLQQALLQDIENKVIPKVAADWEQLAIFLGVEPTCIDDIKRRTHHQYEHSCREMFRSWMKKERGTGRQPRTRDSVVQAIRRMGQEDLVDQLRRSRS